MGELEVTTVQFEIYYRDLLPEIQEAMCIKLNTDPKKENWDIFPVAVLFRELSPDPEIQFAPMEDGHANQSQGGPSTCQNTG